MEAEAEAVEAALKSTASTSLDTVITFFPLNSRWPNNIIPYRLDRSVGNELRRKIEQSMKEWQVHRYMYTRQSPVGEKSIDEMTEWQMDERMDSSNLRYRCFSLLILKKKVIFTCVDFIFNHWKIIIYEVSVIKSGEIYCWVLQWLNCCFIKTYKQPCDSLGIINNGDDM